MLNRRAFLPGSILCVAALANAQSIRVASPNNELVLTLSTGAAQPEPNAPPRDRPAAGLRYSVEFHGKALMEDSPLGLKLEGQDPLGPEMHPVHEQKGSGD